MPLIGLARQRCAYAIRPSSTPTQISGRRTRLRALEFRKPRNRLLDQGPIALLRRSPGACSGPAAHLIPTRIQHADGLMLSCMCPLTGCAARGKLWRAHDEAACRPKYIGLLCIWGSGVKAERQHSYRRLRRRLTPIYVIPRLAGTPAVGNNPHYHLR